MKILSCLKWIQVFILMTCCAGTVLGMDRSKTFKVSKATKKIRVDGKLDADWKQTEVGQFGHHYRDESASDRQSGTFRMLWDEENLYVFFECEDRFITARETTRDGQPYFDDCAEIFLIPAPAPLDMHLGLEVNLYKASNDFLFLTDFNNGNYVAVKSWNPDFNVAVAIDGTVNDNSDSDRGWSMEFAIPLKLFIGIDKFSPVSPGNKWAFQAVRQDRNDPTGNRRAWSTLYPLSKDNPSVHDPEYFNLLEFVE